MCSRSCRPLSRIMPLRLSHATQCGGMLQDIACSGGARTAVRHDERAWDQLLERCAAKDRSFDVAALGVVSHHDLTEAKNEAYPTRAS